MLNTFWYILGNGAEKNVILLMTFFFFINKKDIQPTKNVI